ncbi:MAG: hypothetical protein IJ724_04095 [Muribaculaceae bacterium]|nr:hypothetical protein [Muribaculaceae bacterium]
MKKEDGKYKVDLVPKWVNNKIVMPQLKEEKLREEINAMMPEGFSFKDGLFSSEEPSHGRWEQKKMFGCNTICCEIVRGHQDYRTPDGMATWYWTYHISIWYTVGKFLGFSLGNEEELDAICQNIAEFIEKEYEVKAMTREELKAMPRRGELFGSESGGSVEKGLFSYWCYTSIERDIYNVDAYELMRALNVETLDDLFKTVKERFCYDTFGEFLKDNSIHFDAYAH